MQCYYLLYDIDIKHTCRNVVVVRSDFFRSLDRNIVLGTEITEGPRPISCIGTAQRMCNIKFLEQL